MRSPAYLTVDPRPAWRFGRCLAIAWLAAAGSAGAAPAQQPGAEPARLAATIRRHVEQLAGPDCAGRGIAEAGGEVAIRYVAAEFERIGLVPEPVLDGYRHPFELAEPRPARFGDRCRLERIGDACSLQLGQDFVPFRFSPDGTAEGRLVFAGYGMVVPELGHDDYARLDCDGAVVLVLRRGPTAGPHGGDYLRHREAMWFRAKLANAANAGAAGLLMVDPDLAADEREAEGLAKAAWASGSASIPCAWIARQPAKQLLARLGVDLDARRARLDADPTDASALDAIGAARVRLVVEAEYRPGILRTANVVGRLPGSGGGDAILLVGAHHDGLGRGEFGSGARDRVGEVHPGADDNASGVAVLLALAELLAGHAPEPLRADVVFVAFGAGVRRQIGSDRLLDAGLFPAERIRTMLNLDMVGRATADRLVVACTGSADAFPAMVAAAGRAVGLADLRTESGLLRGSDHVRFVADRVPALFLHSGIDDTYSRPEDVASLVLCDEAARVARLAAELLRRIDAAPERPAFREVGR